MRRAVVLLSGGLDSTTAAALARREGWALAALTVRYGQVHACEIAAARRVALVLGVEQHVELDVDLARFGGSALTGQGEIPKGEPDHLGISGFGDSGIPEISKSENPKISKSPNPPIPPTYVPARNTVFLSLALAWSEVLGAERILIGVNALDYSGYPDCRPEFISAFEYMASLGTKAGLEGRSPRIWAPLQQLTKAAIVRLGVELGVDFGLTHSCYDPGPAGQPCRHCDSCRLRARGFEEAGVIDPLLSPGP